MGRYTPQTPCAPRAAKHPLRVCSAPRSLKYPRRKEVPPIDFCHIPVSIIKRSEGRSAVAAAAYRSGTKLTNEWDGLTHDYTRKGGVVHAEIMLPAHAPPEFADRSTLWNSVEQIEKARDSQLAREIEAALPRELSGEQQLALVRAYVKDNFVDKGMCADFAIHDKGTGNPHVHIMLTLRPLKENGQWGAKCRKAYDLDENGQRIPDGKGGWKNHREDTTDWNDKGNVEIWRAAWAAYTNQVLESAGRPERIDHRSYKRQGIDKIPSVHLGPAASQMEKRGIRTDKGEVNRQIAADNKLLKEIKARITRLYRWSKAETEKPQTQQSSLAALWEAQQQLNAPRTRTGKIRALQESAALFSFLQANGIQSMLCWCRTSLWKMTSSWRSGAAWDTPYCCALRCSKPAASQNQSFRRIKTEGGFHIGLCTRTQRFNQSQNQGYVQSDPKAAGLLYRRGACRRTAVLFAP